VTRERIGSLVLRAYPRQTRSARGAEMLSMLLDAGGTSSLTFIRECAGLLVGGLRERTAKMPARLRGRHILIAFALGIVGVAAIYASSERSAPAHTNSNIPALAGAIVPYLHHGDLVLVAQPDQTALASRYLPTGLRYFMPHSRLASTEPRTALDRVLTSLAPGQHVLFIRPLTEDIAGWASRRSSLVRQRAAQLGALLAADPKLRIVASAPRRYRGPCCVTDSAVVYVKS
jgi:hypothetical protein